MIRGLERYYNRKKLKLDCEIVTPMFLGNAEQEAEWRSAPFKGLLRYWFRVTQPNARDPQELFKKEARIFGAAGDTGNDGNGKSPIKIMVRASSNSTPRCDPFQDLKPIQHPECTSDRNPNGNINPLLYLAGMGLMRGQRVLHSYFPPGSPFQLIFEHPNALTEELKIVFTLIQTFSAIGARCRNGWGSFRVINADPDISIEEKTEVLRRVTRDWESAFEKDYPNCLGKDEKPLLWKTADSYDNWGNAMRELADVYVGVRARKVDRFGPLNPDGQQNPDERHLLGFPLTHHMAKQGQNWGSGGRHASPLRFFVHYKDGEYKGFVLHLPHAHSKEMPFPNQRRKPLSWQIEVWKEVHNKLDHLMPRATYEECL
jgi:CRISPR-associated protein Cmr1